MAKTVVKARDPYRWNASSWHAKSEWRKWEMVGMARDLSLRQLNLDWVASNVADLEITGAVEAVHFNRTIEGASTLEITLRDPHRHLFSEVLGRSRRRVFDPKKAVPIDEGWQEVKATDIIERAVDIEIDGVYFRLVKVNINWSIAQYVLTFEDRIIVRLKHQEGALSASRAQVTRAEFVLRMLRELNDKVPFVCPELHQKQIIAKGANVGALAKGASSKVEADPDGSGGGFTKKQRFQVRGGTATPTQKRNMTVVLEEASSLPGAKKKSLKAVIEAVIVESNVKNLVGGDRDSRGILQVRDSTAGPIHLDNRDIKACVRHFMLKGFWGKGGAIEIAKKNPKKTAGWVAQQVQGSGVPKAYDEHASEAQHWLDSWGGGSGVTGGGGQYVKSYQYKRDKDENSWDCMTRLAEEVKWRLFMVGKVMYFMSEDDLFRRRVRHVIKPGDDEFIDFQGDVDWGKPINEITMQVAAGRWDAPPGSVIDLSEFGAVDGRWLVSSSSRDWFSPVIELNLKQPGNPKKEPASERITRSDSARSGGGAGLDEGKSADFFRYAQLVSKNTPGYIYGGGHGPQLSSLNSGTSFDCSSSTSWACYKAGMWEKSRSTARVSGDFSSWGLPGRGEKITVWYNSGHVFSIFEDGAGVGKKRFDTGGPGGGGGAKVRDARRPTSGFQARHWPGT